MRVAKVCACCIVVSDVGMTSMNVSFRKDNVSSHRSITGVLWLCSVMVNKQPVENKSIQLMKGTEYHLPKRNGSVAKRDYEKGEVTRKKLEVRPVIMDIV